jgi:glucose 1-dehydrogenase
MTERPIDAAASAGPEARPQGPVRFPIVLEGQPALVTGANSGIGRAVALGLAASGADVIVNYVVDPEAADDVAHQIEALGRKAITIKADVSNEQDVQSMFSSAIGRFGTLHIVVNNAGLQRDAPFHDMTLEQWNKVIGVNLTGQFLCAREAIREFKRRGVVKNVSAAAGKVVCMSSVHQEIPWAGHANYAASKGGRHADDAKLGARSCSVGDPGQWRRAWSDPYTDQPTGVGIQGRLRQPDDTGPLSAHR